jgi:tRNA pseudouridine55 synthase
MLDELPVNKAGEDGILLFDKPLTWTSFQLVKKVRYLLRNKKTGHAGTLDPLATGLVVLCTGKATKVIDAIQAQQKTYTGTICLGAITDSYDLETTPQPVNFSHIPSLEEVLQTAASFVGLQQQIPPIFSAIKVGGKRAYAYAREGASLEMKSREVTIYSFEVLDYTWPHVHFKVQCSKGTYIRSLAFDFGNKIGTGAHLSALRRTQIGDYSIENAFTVDSFTALVQQHESI